MVANFVKILRGLILKMKEPVLRYCNTGSFIFIKMKQLYFVLYRLCLYNYAKVKVVFRSLRIYPNPSKRIYPLKYPIVHFNG
jgi:hypothetical protein